MNIVNFTPISALFGGLTIGFAVLIFFLRLAWQTRENQSQSSTESRHLPAELDRSQKNVKNNE